MKIYMDNCCFNRPFDDQSSLIIQLETEAKLHIQELIKQGAHRLCWSFVLDYENSANPYQEINSRIAIWKTLASSDCSLSNEISLGAEKLMKLGLRQMDASHIACAIFLNADCFLTTDKKIINKQMQIEEIDIMNPIDFIRRYPDEE